NDAECDPQHKMSVQDGKRAHDLGSAIAGLFNDRARAISSNGPFLPLLISDRSQWRGQTNAARPRHAPHEGKRRPARLQPLRARVAFQEMTANTGRLPRTPCGSLANEPAP